MVIVLLLIGLLIPLAGCGRKSTLAQPPGGTYPREYPTE